MQTVRDRPIAWPLPPFHVLTEAGGADGPEGCQVTLRDGRIAKVLRGLTDAASVRAVCP